MKKLLVALLFLAGCGHVKAWQREKLASAPMQFEMDSAADGQEQTILEITEGSTFTGSGGSAGGGCGCH